MESRRVLYVDQNERSPEVGVHLRNGGWTLFPATDLAAVRRTQKDQHLQVGVLVLSDFSPERLGWIEDCLQRSSSMEWVAVFDVDALDSPVLRDLVLSRLFDYHTLPVDWRVLDLTLGHALRRAQLLNRNDGPLQVVGGMGMIGHSALVVQLQQKIRKVAPTDAPVLISGASGTGKELTARAIHRCSLRAGGPFVPVDCGAITPSLIHSELFGHERGSFTGATSAKRGLIEAASGGTLFLDEIANLPLDLQTNLLRFLQEHTIHRVGSSLSLPVDVRVVTASHVDLADEVAAGRFREDLFYRLNVLPIVVPSLRERLSDVPLLSQHFLERCMAGKHLRVQGFSRLATAAMMAYDWPGNVRELSNRVQRATVMTDQILISPVDLGLELPTGPAGVPLDAARTVAERDAISQTLERSGRNITKAARELRVSRMTLYRLMDKHGLAARDM